MEKTVRDPRTYAIIGAAMEIHRELGPGFLEAVYQEALAIELEEREVPFQQEVELAITYKGRRLSKTYRADLICFDGVVVELKAESAFTNLDQAQMINYLKATGNRVGLLLNFGAGSLETKRMIYG